MQRLFIRKEDIPKVFGNTLNPNEDYNKMFFVGCDDITLDNNIYTLDKSRAEYDALGDAVEAFYLRNVKLKLIFFVKI
jgi:hypothetical protein